MANGGVQRAEVPRRRLLGLAEQRFSRRLLLIEAGAGYGKTSLIRQAMSESADVDRAIEVAIMASDVAGGSHDSTAVLGAIADALRSAPTVEAVADAVLAASPRDVVVWVDDAHLVSNIGTLIEQLLEVLPMNGHLVIVGRTLPSVRTARLELVGDVVRLGEDDLRFDHDERAAFCHLRGATSPICSSDGWPALMELELLAGRSGAVEYLADEVLSSIADDRLRALRRLASLDAIDAAMLDAVTDFDGTLAELVSGLALVHSRFEGDDDGAVVQVELHDLLRDALRSGVSEADRHDSSVSIAHELLRRGDVNAAAQLFAQVGHVDGVELVAYRLIDDLHFAAAVGDRLAAVETVLEELGESVVALTLRAVSAAILDPSAAPAALDLAVRRARDQGRTDLETTALLRLAELAYNRGALADVQRYAREMERLAGAGEILAERFAILPELWMRRLSGRVDEIVDLVDSHLETHPGIDGEMHALVIFYRTISLAYVGRIRESLREVDRNAGELPPGLFADRLGGFVTIQHWMLGELTAEVRQHASDLVDRIEARGQAHLFAEGAATVAIFSATAGDLEGASSFVERAERAIELLPDGVWAEHSVAQARAVVDVLRGDEVAAAERLERSMPAGGPADGLPSHIYDLTMPISYLLVPRTRSSWDRTTPGPDFELRRDVAHALVAFRERDDPEPAEQLPWTEMSRMRPWALEPHLTELAVAAVASGSAAAADALRTMRHETRDDLSRLQRSSIASVAAAAERAIRVTPRRPAAVVEIDVLGDFAVRRGGVDETDTPPWKRARVVDLLCALVAERKVSRRRLGAMLWPDKDEKAAMNNLRVNLSHLLAALEPDRDRAAPSWFVRAEGDALVLEPSDLLRIDVDRFDRLIADARHHDALAPRRALAAYLDACSIHRGDYLQSSTLSDDFFFDALRIRGDFVGAAVRAADLLLSTGEADEAERLAALACSTEPLNEPAHRSLAAAMLAQRRVDPAIAVIVRLVRQLGEVGVSPEPDTQRLANRLGLSAPR